MAGWPRSPEGSFFDRAKKNLYHNIKNYKNISFYETTSELFLKENVDNLKEYTISAIYIDGAHILDLIKIDVHLALSCIENNEEGHGEILFDDLHVDDVQTVPSTSPPRTVRVWSGFAAT